MLFTKTKSFFDDKGIFMKLLSDKEMRSIAGDLTITNESTYNCKAILKFLEDGQSEWRLCSYL